MWEPPKYPGSCFDFDFDRFEGLMFETEKLLENVCAAGASPVAGVSFFTRFHSLSHRILLLSLSMICSSSMSCAVGWSGCVRKKRNGNHFFGVENSKKRVRSGVKNWPGIRTRFYLLVLAHFPKAQKTVAFLGPHFSAGEPLSSSFWETYNLDAERPLLQQDASG